MHLICCRLVSTYFAMSVKNAILLLVLAFSKNNDMLVFLVSTCHFVVHMSNSLLIVETVLRANRKFANEKWCICLNRVRLVFEEVAGSIRAGGGFDPSLPLGGDFHSFIL